FSERWTIPAREIPHFPGGGALLRVRFCIFRAVDCSTARDSAFLERWRIPAREILHFPSGGALLRVGFCISRAVAIPARGILHFPSGGEFRIFRNVRFIGFMVSEVVSEIAWTNFLHDKSSIEKTRINYLRYP